MTRFAHVLPWRLLAPRGPQAPDAALRDAQMRALTHQIPLLQTILSLNTLLLCWSFLGRAPPLLSTYLPIGFSTLFIWRALAWWRMRRTQAFAPQLADRLLRQVTRLCLLLGPVCSLWAISLCRYGDAAGQMHVAFYMAITVIGCIFCLTHLPVAARTLTVTVVIPFMLAFLLRGDRDIPIIAVNAGLVFVCLLIVQATQYRSFVDLVGSRERILAAQAKSETLNAENVRLANLDQMTGLPNRRIFFETLAARLEQPRGLIAVALVDLDGFKPVNDIYGHAAGDQVLVQAAARLAGFAAPGAVSRLGGDEFALIVEDCADAAALLAWGERVCEALRAPYALTGGAARLSGSVGLSTFATPGAGGQRLLEHADYALYSIKATRPGSAALFSAQHERELHRVAMVGHALRSETLAQELSLAFQPLVDSHSGATTGFEALARWTSPALGPVSPQEFIGVAERLGLVSRLTPVLLRMALATAATWPAPLRLSFNLSANDLMDAAAMAAVRALVLEGDVAASRIDFEVTETAVMTDFDTAAAALQSLRALGCGISLDDFGTGSSSLSYVHRLPLDKIKIDRSFIADLDSHAAATGIVGTIVAMCRNLGLDCIVEGVETQAQLLRLRQLGCRMMQGYLFSPPLASTAVAAHLAAQATPAPPHPAAAVLAPPEPRLHRRRPS